MVLMKNNLKDHLLHCMLKGFSTEVYDFLVWGEAILQCKSWSGFEEWWDFIWMVTVGTISIIMRTMVIEIRRIERVDRTFTRKDNWVWIKLILLETSIVICVFLNVVEGVPDMIPEDELSDRPIGRDPDEIENESSSPSTLGVIENELFNVRA